jgi:hypothetical protein
MSDAEQFLDDARMAFRLASDSLQTRAVAHYAEMGRDYLQRSHDAAELVMHLAVPATSWWKLL